MSPFLLISLDILGESSVISALGEYGKRTGEESEEKGEGKGRKEEEGRRARSRMWIIHSSLKTQLTSVENITSAGQGSENGG
jgi:hypothetical protein